MPESAQLAFTLLIVFGSAKLLAEICERLLIPGLVGEILAGILIGPAVFGWISPSPLLESLSELGVMFLLFRVGLEVNPIELFRVGRTAIVVALGGVLLPFAMGWALMRFLGATNLNSLFIGAALVATSVGITAQVLASRGLLWHKASRTILAAAVIDDVLGLFLLALITSMAKGAVDWWQIGSSIWIALAFVIFAAFYGRKAVAALVSRSLSFRIIEFEFSLAMVLLFGLSAAAIYVGVAAIIGAFLAGLAFSTSGGQRLRDLSSGAAELLVPFFLAGIGLHVQLAGLAQYDTLLLCAALLVAAVFSKLIGCGAGAIGQNKQDRLRIGVGMIPRGEVGMVVAQLGLAAGAITQQHFSVLVVVCVATTVVAPPLLTLVYKGVEKREIREDAPVIH